MPGFDGAGPRGMGPMTGGGRGLCGPYGMRGVWEPYPARRWAGYVHTPWVAPNREQELDFLKGEAQVLRNELKELETEIGKLSAEKE